MITKIDTSISGKEHRILLQVKEFICMLPHPNLREYVSNYNITFPSKELMSDSFTVLPCGCSTISVEKNSSALYVDLHGPVTKPFIAGNEANQLEMMVSIEFKPAGLYAITGISQSEFTDRTLPFDSVNANLTRLMLEAVEKSGSINELVSNLDNLLCANICAAYRPELMMALASIKECAGSISIQELSNLAHYSERQLNRIFNHFVGTSAKSFSRLIRINNTFRLLKKTCKSLSYISDVSGFHDLPHFIHDFKQVCGVTPQKFRDNVSDFYNNPTRL